MPKKNNVETVFPDLFASTAGKLVRALVQDPVTGHHLDATVKLGIPPVQVIEQDLVRLIPTIEAPKTKRQKAAEAPKARASRNRLKQFVGLVVKEVMDRRGYVVARKNVRVRNGKVFSRGSVYEPKIGVPGARKRKALSPGKGTSLMSKKPQSLTHNRVLAGRSHKQVGFGQFAPIIPVEIESKPMQEVAAKRWRGVSHYPKTSAETF